MTNPDLPLPVYDSISPPDPLGERIYFPELDGLRFIAFMMVFLFHGGLPRHVQIEVFGSAIDRILTENGAYGVQFFFILSGYLITTLLLREEQIHGRISLKAFWVRRVLRIWPLYYLIIVIGFFLLPALLGDLQTAGYRHTIITHLLPFLAFLGNWSMVYSSPIVYDWLSILWSVCVEEQFYVVVPLLIAFVTVRLRVPVVLILIVAAIAVRNFYAARYFSNVMIVFNTFAQFDTLLAGVLLALVLGSNRDRPRLKQALRWLQWPVYAATIWLFSRPNLGHGTLEHRTWDFVAVWLCGVAIVMVAVWGQGWLNRALSYSRLVWLGKISYGLYMFHEISILARRQLEIKAPWFPNKEELLAIACLAFTIALAAASYYGYEQPFLRLKRGWTKVRSRPV